MGYVERREAGFYPEATRASLCGCGGMRHCGAETLVDRIWDVCGVDSVC